MADQDRQLRSAAGEQARRHADHGRVAGDPQFTTREGRGRGAYLRAYDKNTGAQVGEVFVPAPVVGHPMTYSLDGRQQLRVKG